MDDAINRQKQIIRRSIAQLCSQISNKARCDERLQKKLERYIHSLGTIHHILSYRARADEINLDSLHECWRKQGIVVYVARSARDPAISFDPELPPFEVRGYKSTVCIVPGRAFTREGKRIGYGIGAYDRFLAKHPRLKTVSVAYGFQIIDYIPTAPYDYSIDKIIS